MNYLNFEHFILNGISQNRLKKTMIFPSLSIIVHNYNNKD